MERVALLVEETGERIRCLLNPDSLVVRRLAGVQARKSLNGRVSGGGLSDDPLVFTGGGTTELTLDLLFDTTLSGSSIQTENVRNLTAPLWQLAENSASDGSSARPPVVRFVWGKIWNIPGVITAVSERFEQFDSVGSPRRSWLRMRLVRVPEMFKEAQNAPESLPAALSTESVSGEPQDTDGVFEVIGGTDPDGGRASESLSDIAFRRYGSPVFWRLIAWANNVEDPLRIASGALLRIPSIHGERS